MERNTTRVCRKISRYEEQEQQLECGKVGDRKRFVGRTVAAVCRLAGRSLRVAVYRFLKTRAIAVCGIAVYRFHKLINDMRNIRMTMPNIQLNFKFVNNMSPEWDRMILERFSAPSNGPLALVSNVQPYAQSSPDQSHLYSPPSSSFRSPHVQLPQYPQFAKNSQLDSRYTQTHQMIDTLSKQVALLAQSFRANLPQTNNQLRTSSNTQNQATVQDGMIVVQNVQERQNQKQRNFARGAGAAGNEGAQNRAGYANQGQAKCYNCSGFGHIARNYTQPKRLYNFEYCKDKMMLMQAQENGAVLDEEELLFLAGEQTNTFDVDVDEQPSIFMENLSSASPVSSQAGPSNASILYEVPDLENNIDHVGEIHDEHGILNEVQQTSVVDSNNVDMGNSNIIPYEQYVMNNKGSVVPNNVSCVRIDDSLAAELSIYKEQVAIYDQCAKFELTEREQRMDDQMRDQNTFYLKKAKKAQPALYDGDELLKMHHAHVIVPTSEEELELVDVTKMKIAEKLKNDSEVVKWNITHKPLNYSKENIFATFTPRTVLTPEQVFWSKDLLKQKSEALKAKTPPLKVLPPTTVYPPNTPVHLVPRTLPTKTLVKEVKEMKVAFENIEANVDQNAIDKKCDEIERKHLLITNENLIANCLTQDVFYTVTNSALTASRLHDLYVAYNVAKTRAVELEAENFRLNEKIQPDDQEFF
nr:hypothetical protein [Tanacetum cinerariifolium]